MNCETHANNTMWVTFYFKNFYVSNNKGEYNSR